MADNGKGLAVFGLIIGLIGLGLGGYAFFETTIKPMVGLSEPVQKIDTYYYEELNYSPDTTGLENVTESGITIIVTQNSSLYVCFNCYVLHYSGSFLTQVALYINDVSVSPYMRVTTNDAAITRTPLTLQYFDDVIEPGTYILTIKGTMEDPSGLYVGVNMYAEIISPV